MLVNLCEHEQIKTIRDFQFTENRSQMIAQGLFADAKLMRYFFVRSARLACEGAYDGALFLE